MGNATVKIMSPEFAEKFEQAKPDVKIYFAHRVLTAADPYTPFDTGMLKNLTTAGGSVGIEHGGEIIHYNVPYARRQTAKFITKKLGGKV